MTTCTVHYTKLDGTRAEVTYQSRAYAEEKVARAKAANPSHNMAEEYCEEGKPSTFPHTCFTGAPAVVVPPNQADLDEWWETEGRFEMELEERGETKYFHAHNARRRQFGRRQRSAREYLKS